MTKPEYRCGMEAVLDLVGGKWKLLILYHLFGQRLRFAALRRCIGGVSEKMLSQQLKELAADGLLHRIDFKTVPPHVEYEITAFGKDFVQRMQPLCEWGEHNKAKIASLSEARAIRDGKDVSKSNKSSIPIPSRNR